MTIFVGDEESLFDNAQSAPIVRFGFSSLQVMIDHVQTIKLNRECSGAWATDENTQKFCATASMGLALHTARNGWQAGTERAEEIAQEMTGQAVAMTGKGFGVAGHSVSVGRMLSGNPEHMRTRRTQITGSRVLTIYSQAAASAGISATAIATRAAMIAAVCDTLENRGYTCNVVQLVTVQSYGGKAYELAVNLKTAGQKMSVSDLVFGLGHPSFLRRFCFALVADQPKLRRIWVDQGQPAKSAQEKEPFYIGMYDYDNPPKDNKSLKEAFDRLTTPALKELVKLS